MSKNVLSTGDKIRIIRATLNLSQFQFGDQVGLGTNAVSLLENDYPQDKNIKLIEAAIGRPLNDPALEAAFSTLAGLLPNGDTPGPAPVSE